MDIKVNITYSIEDALKELGEDRNVHPIDDILVLNAEDKFFIGGGCESLSPDSNLPRNISVCMEHPIN